MKEPDWTIPSEVMAWAQQTLKPVVAVETVYTTNGREFLDAIRRNAPNWVRVEAGEGVDFDTFSAWLLKSIWRDVELRMTYEDDRPIFFMRRSGEKGEQT